jgi:hypothetical protein
LIISKGTLYYKFLNDIFIWMDIFIFSVLPFVIMTLCTIIIISRIQSGSRHYMNSINNSITNKMMSKRVRRDRQLLYILLMTNFYFVLSTAPYCVSFLMKHGKSSDSMIGQLTVHVLLYTNNAFNFVFYGISIKKYRQEVCKIFMKKRARLQAKPSHVLSSKECSEPFFSSTKL